MVDINLDERDEKEKYVLIAMALKEVVGGHHLPASAIRDYSNSKASSEDFSMSTTEVEDILKKLESENIVTKYGNDWQLAKSKYQQQIKDQHYDDEYGGLNIKDD